MKILFIEWKSFGNEDILETFRRLKYNIVRFKYENDGVRHNEKFEKKFEKVLIKERPDFVFSFNFFPIISKVCNTVPVKYVSWVYDSPHISLYSYTLINPCNYIFIFDSKMYETYALQGIKTVYYLPLAANTKRLDEMRPNAKAHEHFDSDITFVGQMYIDAHNFYDRMEPKLDDYTKGYLEAVMNAQMQVDGYNFVESCLNQNIMEGMQKALPMEPHNDGIETAKYMYAQYVLDRKITSLERIYILAQIGKEHKVKLFTPEKDFHPEGVENCGKLDYYQEMPIAFKCAKINLNITLRSIEKGIPLRCIDVMGAGGFLLTNYQEDMLMFFEPGVDFVYYESRQDLLEKIDYYLKHDEERRAIAASGHEKVAKYHTFDLRVAEMIKVVIEGD